MRVREYREQLNSINVFPVADSDTGTNMAGTMQALVEGIAGSRSRSLAEVSRSAADAALTGARGNSGTILSQFFFGIADGIEEHRRLTTAAFSRIARRAVNYTYRALAEPTEGTILTVLRAWTEKLEELSARTPDFATLFSDSLEAAREALRSTRATLPSLRRAKVVDAGAQGMVHLIEGIVQFIEQGTIREIEAPTREAAAEPALAGGEAESLYRYCTECLISGESIPGEELRLRLATLGDSLIVAGSPSKTKLHIHTDEPEQVFRIAEKFGILSGQKAEDMHKQYAAAHAPHTETALVIDSACDLPAEYLEKSFVHMVPVRVIFGEKSYIDKVALTPEHYYELLRSRRDVVATTSQPAPADFEKTFAFLTAHYRQVIYLGLSGALSGTLAAAKSALTRLPRRERVQIIDSRSATVGAGLVARRAIEAIEQGLGAEELKEAINGWIERSRLLIAIPSLEALLRSGRLGKTKGLVATLLGLRPLLALDAQGRVVKTAMVRGAEAGLEKLLTLLQRRAERGSDVAIGHVDAAATARRLRERIETLLQPTREIFINDASPALATHTGFGTLAVAYFAPAERDESPGEKG
jgi:hypothetical protein